MKKSFILTISAFMLASAAGMAQKMSPDTELLLLNHRLKTENVADGKLKPMSSSLLSVDDNELIGAYVTVSGGWVIDKLLAAGCSVGTVIDNIVTIKAPIELIPVIAQMDGVEYLEVGHKVELKNYNTRRRLKVDDIHTGEGDLPRGYTGKGVVVGMIDVGFEFNHIAFRDYENDQRLRVKRVWNQSNSNGVHPDGYSYGSEYKTTNEIIAAKNDGQAEFHGTHTTGTAAGAPVGNNYYYGMAIDSDIVLVSCDLTNDTHLVDAIKYIFDYAESEGKPCVINMSLGSHNGPHDGTSAIDRSIDALTGPGRIVVGAAGNEADVDMHCSKTFTATDTTLKTMMAYTPGYSKETLTYFWGTPGKKYTVEVALVDPTKKGSVKVSGGVFSSDSEASAFYLEEGVTSDILIQVSPVVTNDGMAPQMAIRSSVTSIANNRKQAFIVRGEDGGTVHLWNAANNHYFVKGNIADFTAGDDLYTVGEIGGTGRNTITVGSYDSDSLIVFDVFDPNGHTLNVNALMNDIGYSFETGARSVFSSRGPSVDGRLKPEVMAPGSLIISSYNGSILTLDNKVGGAGGMGGFEVIRPSVDTKGNVYYYDVSMGTSQATPAVTGAIALWLEANPNLTPDDVRDIISRTAVRDKFTGSEPNNDCGYGKMDAYAGIRDILGLTSAIDNVAVSDNSTKVWVENGSTIYCATPGTATASIYSMSGALVDSFTVTPDSRSFNASHLAKGIYVVNVAGQGINKGFKVIIK